MANAFPPDFLWGCATSAYQIEGSPLADGAGPSIWQRFAHTPGMMADGNHGDVACDHYNRYKADVALMKQLGMQAYRFSLNWARLLPEGTGRINPKGVDFYSRLIDELLANDIQPMATLFHWDLPATLDDRGGWLNRDSANWFADYAEVAFKAFDGRVKRWATINEPWVVSNEGYLRGTIAPGHRSLYEAAIASHNLMRAHGAAVKAYRATGRHEIGLCVNIEPKYAASDRPEDVAAAARDTAYMNAQYLDPALLGSYPAELREVYGEAWIDWPAEDFELTRQPVDFVGVNYYTRAVIQHDEARWPLKAAPVKQAGATYTEMGWEVFPQGLTDTLTWVKARYGDVVIYITENGAAFPDPSGPTDGCLNDPLRVSYFQSHLKAVQAAMAQGVDVRGYFAWSLMDNLEWSLGFAKRFGLVHVDFETLARSPKDSALYYSRIIASHGAAVDAPLP